MPFSSSRDANKPLSLTKEELRSLAVVFDREKINPEFGPQFLRIITTITTKEGHLYDKTTQFAFTFPKTHSPEEEKAVLKQIADEISVYGFISRKKIDTVNVELDSIPDWAVVKIGIKPDEDYTKYSSTPETKQEYFFRAKGGRFESAFFFGIPKVLYDTNKKDTIAYGNASAMIRFYYLDSETGKRFPVNIGIGTFGVSTPIDVSKNGGGFALSVLLDVVEIIRKMKIDLSPKFNAGIEVVPFVPLQRQARILVNARVGYSP